MIGQLPQQGLILVVFEESLAWWRLLQITREAALTEAVGSILDGGLEAETEILGKLWKPQLEARAWDRLMQEAA